MPKLKAKAVKASYQRRGGSSSKKSSDDELRNDFFINLTGDDELCDTQEDHNTGVDFIDDLVDGDAAILNDLRDSAPLSTESILEAWRNSVSRQHDTFIRRGESQRSKQRHEKSCKDLEAISKEIPKITTFFVATTSSSSSSSSQSSSTTYEELSMDEIMSGLNIDEAEDAFAESMEVIEAALVKIEADFNFSIPQSHHADKKLTLLCTEDSFSL